MFLTGVVSILLAFFAGRGEAEQSDTQKVPVRRIRRLRRAANGGFAAHVRGVRWMMRGGALCASLLAVSCVMASVAAVNALGSSAWAYALGLFGVGFAVAPHSEQLRSPASLVAMFAGVLSLLSVALILLAANTAGSIWLPGEQAAFVAALSGIGVFGVATGITLRGGSDAS